MTVNSHTSHDTLIMYKETPLSQIFPPEIENSQSKCLTTVSNKSDSQYKDRVTLLRVWGNKWDMVVRCSLAVTASHLVDKDNLNGLWSGTFSPQIISDRVVPQAH